MRLLLLCCLSFALIAYDNDSPKTIDPDTLPGPVYALDSGGLYAVAEAEHLAAVDLSTPDGDNTVWWTTQDSSSGGAGGYWSGGGQPYLGDGFVKYTGPQRQGPDFLEDHDPYVKMGPKEHWLVIKFYVAPGQEGEYQLAYRYAHKKHDGDNDCFAASVGISDELLERSGWNARNQFKFTPGFENRANSRHYCDVGVNAFYISGRSKGFAVDRLVVWKRNGGDSAAAINLSTPESPLWSDGEEGEKPTAAFSVTPEHGEAPLLVAFNGGASSDDGTIVSYAWNFGDGTSGSGETTSHTYTVDGTYTASLTVTDDGGNTDTAEQVVTVVTQGPYDGSAQAIPGTVEVEYYDVGGEGIAYHDSDERNRGGDYRTDDGVDLETCAEGGFNVSHVEAGEWLEFTVDVARAANYRVIARTAANNAGGQLSLEQGGTEILSGLAPGTGGWQNWVDTDLGAVSLSAGEQVLRLNFDEDGYNVNYLRFEEVVATPTRQITMQAVAGHIWQIVPDGTEAAGSGGQQVFGELDPAADHALTPVTAGDG